MDRPAARTCWMLLGALAALAGCTVGPSFDRPRAAAPAAYVAAKAQPPTPVASPAGTIEPSSGDYTQRVVLGATPIATWWTLFQSPALDTLVQRALAENHTLAAARATLAQAHELAAAANGARYPQISLNAGAGRQQYGKELFGPLFSLPAFSYEAVGGSVSYTLDYLGGISRSIEQQRALAQYQQNETEAAALALTGSVVTQALIVAATQAQMRAVEELLDEDRDNLRLVRTAFDNGSVSRVDVLTAQSQLATDTTLLPPLHQQLAVAQHALAVLIGHAPADAALPDFELSALKLPRELPVSLPSELAHRRPDILAAEAQLHAATAAVGVATANLYPQITLTASGGYEAVPGEPFFASSNTAWTLISGLTQPLFDGGTLRARRRAALDAVRASAARYQEVVLESFAQVADVLDALDHDAELLSAQSNALAAAQSSVELARESYSAGNTGVLQVLDAQRQRLEAQLGVVRAQAQRYLDTAQLFLALGGTAL
jgi:NodT family efflux transporter outer membrane factor (OMF) lipoprotein